MENLSLPPHVCHVEKSTLIINRLHVFLHGFALLALIYYRFTNLYFLYSINTNKKIPTILFPHILVFASELILSFFWVLDQSFQWRPVSRTIYPERLPKDDNKIPSIDVFICTSDPIKEPSFEVVNNVISAMALDYPSKKLHVYLSDDGGSSLTLFALKEAWNFARLWLPFCRKFGIKNRCPKAYFGHNEEISSVFNLDEFLNEKEEVQVRVLRLKS